MCCVFTVLLFLGPRFGILVWWIVQPARWEAAFNGFLWALLGFIFLPWTTLMYVAVRPGGLSWFDWVLLIFAVLADISTWSGGGYRNRNAYQQYGAR